MTTDSISTASQYFQYSQILSSSYYPSHITDLFISSLRGVTGSCISYSFDEGISGCTCSISDAYSCRNGTFHAGITCGGASSIKGACCLTDRENKTQIPCQETTFCGCYAIADSFNFNYIWTAFTKDRTSCDDFSCGNSVDKIGACCNGQGKCRETTKEKCELTNHFFQGIGSVCTEDDKNICIFGIGACCQPDGTCIDGITGTDCIFSGKLYLGESKRCYEFNVTPDLLPCFSSLPGYILSPGDIVENSMVVGIFKPSETLDGFDLNGYGRINEENINDISDSYIILVSLFPLSLNDNYNFTWNNGGMAYGPLISPSGRIIETKSQEINEKKEGYIFNTQLSNDINESVIFPNFSLYFARREEFDTPEERSFRNTEHNINGRWSESWGLHNTIRMVNAELFYEAGMTYDSYLYSDLYSPSADFGSDKISAVTALRQLNKNTTIVSDNISSWFIPSISELSFLADQCIINGMNDALLNNGGVPLSGKHWSSTGTFNYNGSTAEGEGTFNGTTAAKGSYAWSVDFSDSIMKKEKDNRLIDKQIRPIRIVRCDGLNLKNSQNRLWWRINT